MKSIFLRRTLWVTAFLLIGLHAHSFAQLSDDFSDNDFSHNPAWMGDTSDFAVNSDLQLQLDAPPSGGLAYLSTDNHRLSNTEWTMYVKLNFSPSNSNQLRIYLASDALDLSGNVNGYYIKMGEDGSNDAIELHRQLGASDSLIIRGIEGHVAAAVNNIGLKVTRDSMGHWAIYSDLTGATNYSIEGTGFDHTITQSNYFGFVCRYTSSRSTAFYFDNISITPIETDTIPPKPVGAHAVNDHQLDVTFSEALDPASASASANYFVNDPIGSSSSAIPDNLQKQIVHLTFQNSFQQGKIYELHITGISDINGNKIEADSISFIYYLPQLHDIIINEIMADPDPPVALPDAEYVELYNRSPYAINLSKWSFTDGTTTETFSSWNVQPDSFLILSSITQAPLFIAYGRVFGSSSFPSLNNDGDVLTLSDSAGHVIDNVAYSPAWYQDANKESGGWSLERIDPNSSCNGAINWHASLNLNGGTPGKINSVFGKLDDSIPPMLSNAALLNPFTIECTFSESIDSAIATDISNYTVSYSGLLSAQPIGPDFTIVDLTTAVALDSNATGTVSVSGMQDCAGNVMPLDSAMVAFPAAILPGEVVINEILYNSKPGGYDYLEMYNNSDKVFDLKDLDITSADVNDSVQPPHMITASSVLLFPQQYEVISANINWVKQNYVVKNPQWLLQTTLPAMPDNEGHPVLITPGGTVIDQVHYFDSWQYSLLHNDEGVALERISPNGASQDSTNWHSAASTVGYGTPTYQNSQFIESNVSNEIDVEPQVFSPDGDGFQDVLSIGYRFAEAGYQCNVKIFDAAGNEVRNLVNNQLLGQSGQFIWDGTKDNDEKASIGIYIIYVQVFDLKGNQKNYKRVCVVAGKKN